MFSRQVLTGLDLASQLDARQWPPSGGPIVEIYIYTSIADNERFGQGMKKVSEGGVFGY